MAIKENLRNYAKEAKGLGVHPISAPSIARRKFDVTGKLIDTLVEYILVAHEEVKELDIPMVGLANAYYEYLPTPEEVEYGGYETWLSINRVEKQASLKITNELIELINNLK